jgi:hypothetical protein
MIKSVPFLDVFVLTETCFSPKVTVRIEDETFHPGQAIRTNWKIGGSELSNFTAGRLDVEEDANGVLVILGAHTS